MTNEQTINIKVAIGWAFEEMFFFNCHK